MDSAQALRFASDDDLWARQAALQAEAAAVLADMDLTTILADVGPTCWGGT